jgi:iron complex outermembrane receptor protein
VCFLWLLSATTQGHAQQPEEITGTITAAESGQPLAGTSVSIVGSSRAVVANPAGQYRLRIRPGTWTLRATLIGYAPVEREVTVVAGQPVTVDLQMEIQALEVGQLLVVVGSRTARTAVETPVPIDVISAEQIIESGHTEVNQILRELVPSYHASHQTIGDGTDHINPASLRGLGPDQTLVLINGKRRHSSALVHVNGTFGRGTVGVDLNSIPISAIERIEVLRDGASAQYGSDAIAGVVNIVLKEQTSEIQFTTTVGATGGCLSQPNRADTGEKINLDWDCDGQTVQAGINYGFPISDRGFFNITGQYLNRERTNRSGAEERDFFLGIEGDEATDAELARRGLTRADLSMKTGQSAATFGAVFFNTSLPVGTLAEVYASGGASFRDGEATGFYRRPNQEERVVPSLFPNGFLPQIHTDIRDVGLTAGARGDLSGWDLDLSATTGSNRFLFNIENTNNGSQGASSPVTFDAGALNFRQTTGNFDAVRPLSASGFKSLSVALGGEFRVENYKLEEGEFGSYACGLASGQCDPSRGDVPGVDYDTTSAGQPKAAGSQVFPGFQPTNAANRNRTSISAYAAVESEIGERFVLDVAGRFEDYSDFGSRATWKVAGRAELGAGIGLRAAASTGFRAPSLHQVWFNNVSTQFLTDPVTGEQVPRRVLTANNLSGVARAFGVAPLEEETSLNLSGGLTWRPIGNFSLTADVYYIKIDDRIVLSSRFASGDDEFGMQIGEILEPFESLGVTQAQFFVNAVDTETTGVDIVAAWADDVGAGRLGLDLAANFTSTDVKETKVSQSMREAFDNVNIDRVAHTLFNREERNRLEDALPRVQIGLTGRYSINKFTSLLRGSWYGNVKYKPDCGFPVPSECPNDEEFGDKFLLDLELGYRIFRGTNLAIGAQNLLNTYPDQHENLNNRDGERFIFSRRVTQFGSNGGFYYVRLDVNL